MEKYSFENAQDEAMKMQEKIKSGTENYGLAEKQVESEYSSEVEKAREKLGSVVKESVEKKKLRDEYRNALEKMFQKFLSEFGDSKFSNMKSFLIYWQNFRDFLNKEEITSNTGYDLGLRFNIDTVLNNSNTHVDNKKIIREYLLKCIPYTNPDHQEIKGILFDELITKTENPQQLIDDISEIIHKSSILDAVTRGPLSFLLANEPGAFRIIKGKNINIYDGTDDGTNSVWIKSGRNMDATWNSSLSNSEILNIRNKISRKLGLNFEENEEEEELAIQQDVLRVFKQDFGIDLEEILQKIKL